MGGLGERAAVVGVEGYPGENVVGCVAAFGGGAVGCHCCDIVLSDDLGERPFATALFQVLFRDEADESRKRSGDHGFNGALPKELDCYFLVLYSLPHSHSVDTVLVYIGGTMLLCHTATTALSDGFGTYQ